MGEVLSQSEIDNLLKALSSGELDVDEMKNTEEKRIMTLQDLLSFLKNI